MTGGWARAASVRRRRPEAGQAAGAETIPFGVLVFVAGTLVVVNAWAVVDTRTALDTAARDYLRAYTSAPTSAEGRAAGRVAAVESLAARTSSASTRITDPPEPFGPCRPATVRLEVEVPAMRVPFLGTLGTHTVSTTQTELVQPYGRARDEAPFATVSPCDG